MSNTIFDPESYLRRIGLTLKTPDNISATSESLDLLHQAQCFNIPFENLDIQLGHEISLNPDQIFKKLVLSSRGGYCFELNGLLLMALNHFGFKAHSLLARVHIRGTPTGRTHQVIMVTINNKPWLADVGFGGSGLVAPIPFEINRISEQNGSNFRLVENPDYGTMLQLEKEQGWQDIYSLDLAPVKAEDIAMSHYFTSTHPQSPFCRLRMVTMPLPLGRITLLNLTLKTQVDGTESVAEILPGQSYIDALTDNFSLQLAQPYETLQVIEE